jgi:hypothetical protein
MKHITRKFASYLLNHFIGNFLGFAIGMGSTRLVAHFFTTRRLNNLWGLTSRKTVVDRQTFHVMEWAIAIIIGFIVFELVSKWVQKKADQLLPKYKFTRWMAEEPVKESAA